MIRALASRERAETLALEALAFLAGEPEALGRFLGLSGLDAAALRRRASDPDVLRAVVEFLLNDDGLTGEFCRRQDIQPRELHLAGHFLEQK